jgi:catechol 2,3-dioxygenase-like lactoylglutathione lyase family enzyme
MAVFDHVGIHVRDLRATKRFYTTVLAPLGFSLTAETDEYVEFGALSIGHRQPRRLRLLAERVVVERPRDDHWIDPPGDVLERAQAGGLDHVLAAATGSDDSGGRLVGPRA